MAFVDASTGGASDARPPFAEDEHTTEDERQLPVLVFDGQCRFCSAVVDWLARRLQRRTYLLPFQASGPEQLTAMGLSDADVRRTAWWLEPDGQRFHSAQAVARALIACGGLWRRLGLVLLAPGVRRVGAGLYRAVARTRHRLPGATPICSRPGPHARAAGADA